MAEFPIVGIGSSAGGLEALQKLLGAMPPDPGLAFVIAAHLDPTKKSHLSELLGHSTTMPVVQIGQPIEVEPDHVYVIAPDQELTIRGGIVRTQKPTSPRGHRHPVDSFFRSLAEDQGETAIAIVLSGTGTDGSLGLRFVKAEGGIVLAQDPDTAAFQGMPRSAVGTGVVDLVLPPEKMPEPLLELARHSYVRRPAPEADHTPPHDQLRTLLTLVRSRSRQDFTPYKEQMLLRRILRRMSLRRIDRLEDYIEQLRNDGDEIEALTADLTINVTGFFRDPEAWEELASKVIAPLVKERQSGSTIRLWIPACSTGEEAYSIAILLAEHAEAVKKTFELRVFATDVAQGIVTAARAGAYPASIAQDVSAERLRRFFEMSDDTYYVRKQLREVITFAPQNLLQDPPFSRIDLISCRNMLIYLRPEVQKKVLALFHFALREHGHLFLGPAETVSGQDELFHAISKKWRIYRRVGPTRHDVVEFPLIATSREDATNKTEQMRAIEVSAAQPRGAAALADREVLERYAPAAALVDRQARVHYLRGPTDDYLRSPSGEAPFDLISMARNGLRSALRDALDRAANLGREVTGETHVRRDGASHGVRITVVPLRSEREADTQLLVTFVPHTSTAQGPQRRTPKAWWRALLARGATKAVAAGHQSRSVENQLRAEVEAAQQELRVTLEDSKKSSEELKASNEEIRSINEELQASNEELETSKEELQSLNEELNTVNNQLQAKLGELETRTADLNNLLNSTDIATLFLDRNLCIRWFTPAVKALLGLLASDIGRPISHFAQKFQDGDLAEDVNRVLTTLATLDTEVVNAQGRWYLRRIAPYRVQDRIDGVVVTFIDVTERKHAEEVVRAAREFAEHIVDTVREPLLVLTPDLKVHSANKSFYRDFKVTREETEGRPLYELGNGQWDIPELRRLLEEVLPHDQHFSDFEVEHTFESIGRRTMVLNGRRLDHLQLILLAIQDVTERKRAEMAIRDSEERLRKVLETEAVGVIFFDLEGTVIDANETFVRMTGYTRDEIEARQLTWRRMTPPEWIEASEEQLKHLEATGRLGPYEKEYMLKDGSLAWMLFAGADLGDGSIVEFCIDISDRKRAEAERELLSGELSHRVKNVFAVVQSLAMQTNRRTTSVDAFREAFLGRLQALARAHGLLLDSNWRGTDLKNLVEQTAAAYRTEQSNVVEIRGESIEITAEQSLALSLVLHELCTNAVKYGALSDDRGRVMISWKNNKSGAGAAQLRLTWQELNSRPVSPPGQGGFGSKLIESAVKYQLQGSIERRYAGEGLSCEIIFPLS